MAHYASLKAAGLNSRVYSFLVIPGKNNEGGGRGQCGRKQFTEA